MRPTHPSPAEQERLYPLIADALFKSIPDDWDEILLQIEPTESGQIQLVISGPEGVPNLRVPDNSLYPPAIELYDLFVRESCPFLRCDFWLRWVEDDESWRFAAEFAYPPDA
jgi:hypothetical protein